MNSPAALLDALDEPEARTTLLRCCGCRAWADAMLIRRPFGSDERLFETADAVWRSLDDHDLLEAFGAHPRIGGQPDGADEKAAAWSRAEQAGMNGADNAIATVLAEENAAYEAKFGHVFLICATGKSAGEMLDALRRRMHNDARAERRIAAEEQAKITRLRLMKLVNA